MFCPVEVEKASSEPLVEEVAFLDDSSAGTFPILLSFFPAVCLADHLSYGYPGLYISGRYPCLTFPIPTPSPNPSFPCHIQGYWSLCSNAQPQQVWEVASNCVVYVPSSHLQGDWEFPSAWLRVPECCNFQLTNRCPIHRAVRCPCRVWLRNWSLALSYASRMLVQQRMRVKCNIQIWATLLEENSQAVCQAAKKHNALVDGSWVVPGKRNWSVQENFKRSDAWRLFV